MGLPGCKTAKTGSQFVGLVEVVEAPLAPVGNPSESNPPQDPGERSLARLSGAGQRWSLIDILRSAIEDGTNRSRQTHRIRQRGMTATIVV